MSWKDDFNKGFDFTYKLVKKKYSDIKFPCYGGRFYYFLVSRHFENLYFYLTCNSLIYTASSAYITEIPFKEIQKLSIKQGFFFKSSFHIRIVADRKYHLLIKNIKNFSTNLTGDGPDNVRNFIDTLRTSVENNKG